MSRPVTKRLPTRPLTFGEMGTDNGAGVELLLTPFWAWVDGDKDGEEEDLLISAVCAHPSGVSCLESDAGQATRDADLTAMPSVLTVTEQWLFERYPLDELMPVATECLGLLSSESGLRAQASAHDDSPQRPETTRNEQPN
jgi:hypothetical protein